MTAGGYAALESELQRRKSEDRPRIIAAIAEARAHGDLSENAEYHAAKEQQGLNEGRIGELEDLLSRAGVKPERVRGWEQTEPSHAAVAQAVASGAADTGLAIEAAARARGLDFVPLLTEDYYLVCLKSALEQPPVRALRELLHTAGWRERLALLPGYEPNQGGEVLSLRRQLPWWSFAREKKTKAQ